MVEFLLRDGIVRVVVTLGTLHRQSKPGCGRGGRAIDHTLGAILFRVDATLAVEKSLAMKGGSEALFGSRFRDQVTSDLLNGELIEGLVAIE